MKSRGDTINGILREWSAISKLTEREATEIYTNIVQPRAKTLKVNAEMYEAFERHLVSPYVPAAVLSAITQQKYASLAVGRLLSRVEHQLLRAREILE